jgi:diguanylate cyclase (GGDEF)-like protein
VFHDDTRSRSSGTAGRWGGDEFLLIAPVNDADQALALADRGRQLVTNSWIRRDGRRVNVSLTVGVALAQRDEPAYDLVNRARKAMTEEKKAGRARTRAGRSGAQAHGWR